MPGVVEASSDESIFNAAFAEITAAFRTRTINNYNEHPNSRQLPRSSLDTLQMHNPSRHGQHLHWYDRMRIMLEAVSESIHRGEVVLCQARRNIGSEVFQQR